MWKWTTATICSKVFQLPKLVSTELLYSGAHFPRTHCLVKFNIYINFGTSNIYIYINFGTLKYIINLSYCFYLLEGFLLYQTNKIFLAFKKTIVDISIALLIILWLVYFWRWTTLIGSFKFNIVICCNTFNSLQWLIIM